MALGERFAKNMMGNNETKENHKQKLQLENYHIKERLENLESMRTAGALQTL